MAKNLFEQAKNMMMNFTNNKENISNKDKEAIKQAIQAAYNEASPEETAQLQQFEQQLNSNLDNQQQ